MRLAAKCYIGACSRLRGKQNLCLSTRLFNASCSSLLRNLHAELSAQSSLAANAESVVEVLCLLIPGFDENTLDSAIHAFAAANVQDPRTEIMERLCLCLSRKNIRRLLLKLVKGLTHDGFVQRAKFWSTFWEDRDLAAPLNKLLLPPSMSTLSKMLKPRFW